MKLNKYDDGRLAWVADAPNFQNDANASILVGMVSDGIRARIQRGQRYALGQLYGVVCPGLILTSHIFLGLRRRMLVNGDSDADSEKFVFTWQAKRDARLAGPRENCQIEWSDAPPNRVFGVYITPNAMLKEFPDIWGWIEHWAWLPADPTTPGAPIDWQNRYDEQVWHRESS